MDQVEKSFNDYKRKLIHEGCIVRNPLDISPYHPDKTWKDYMKDDIVALLDCNEIHMLPGYESSRGALLEMHIALQLSIKLKIVKDD